ncbi:MAG: M50 family metallopeptidase [Anaerolineales bacterium]|nr:M50 family metallopeptidase [Anaerolineales bacterium]MDW8160423.1 M50 family metallopeptidase [Anaerolineales bacterium]
MNFDLLSFIIGIAILIFFHELGHFVAARLLKVEVEEFGIGFPPRLFKWATIKGTDFTFNLIPLGGFVRIKGENDPEVPGGLAAASPWVRLAVIGAGPLVNILIGVVLSVWLFYQAGEPVLDRVKVMDVAPNSPAERAGLRPGDVILEVEGNRVESVEELRELIYARLGQETRLVYEREGQSFSVTLIPRNPPPENEGAIGILMGYDSRPISLVRAIPRGVNAAFNYVRMLFSLPRLLMSGEISPEAARPVGYKGMFDLYRQLGDSLAFFTAITMSLGVLNLFPLPALDGGRIVFALVELLTRRRVPPRLENAVHYIGFVILLALLIYINILDFVDPVELPF